MSRPAVAVSGHRGTALHGFQLLDHFSLLVRSGGQRREIHHPASVAWTCAPLDMPLQPHLRSHNARDTRRRQKGRRYMDICKHCRLPAGHLFARVIGSLRARTHGHNTSEPVAVDSQNFRHSASV
eukprot:4001068-Pleurochrysis_carterae.AAC.3